MTIDCNLLLILRPTKQGSVIQLEPGALCAVVSDICLVSAHGFSRIRAVDIQGLSTLQAQLVGMVQLTRTWTMPAIVPI